LLFAYGFAHSPSPSAEAVGHALEMWAANGFDPKGTLYFKLLDKKGKTLPAVDGWE
jgi:mannose/cellobiose epimerase-like protein (N-acyl-D-glucosamine 2-epimerase family)